jgi:hypothetical protein
LSVDVSIWQQWYCALISMNLEPAAARNLKFGPSAPRSTELRL